MKQHRIAITGVSGDVGLGAIEGLRKGYPTAWILGLDYSSDCVARRLCDSYIQMPGIDSELYIDALANVLRAQKIDLLLPGIDAELELLSQNRGALETDSGTEILLCEQTQLLKCIDKYETAHWLRRLGLPAPHTLGIKEIPEHDTPESISGAFLNRFPLVKKPRKGHGSVGVQIISNIEELELACSSFTAEDCLQEYIEGPEITCGLLFDRKGNLADWLCMERTLKHGRTVSGEIYESSELSDFIESFADRTRLTGPVNLQLRISPEGVPLVFEINPRLSGSTAMRIAVGFNDPARLITHFLDELPIQPAQVKACKVNRTETTVTVEWSETEQSAKATGSQKK